MTTGSFVPRAPTWRSEQARDARVAGQWASNGTPPGARARTPRTSHRRFLRGTRRLNLLGLPSAPKETRGAGPGAGDSPAPARTDVRSPGDLGSRCPAVPAYLTHSMFALRGRATTSRHRSATLHARFPRDYAQVRTRSNRRHSPSCVKSAPTASPAEKQTPPLTTPKS